MAPKIKELFLTVKKSGWTKDRVAAIFEYDKCYALVPNTGANSYDGSVWMSISKTDGTSQPAEWYSEQFKGDVLKEYSFEEFERLCS